MVKKLLPFIFSLIYFNANAQYGGHDWSAAVYANYITGSKLFNFPKSIDPELRDLHISIDDIFSYGFDIRHRISESLIIGIGAEYIKAGVDAKLIIGGPSGSVLADISEGYELIPVEVSAYYLMPFSSERFLIHIGGGAGIYFGGHLRKLGNVETENISRKFSYGIHVLTGIDYLFADFFSIRAEMKFRDPQFQVKSRYEKPEVKINGIDYLLSQNPIDSKINIDGITFTIGVVYHFN